MDVGSRHEYLLSFCLAWKLSTLNKFSSLSCLNSTYNNYYTLDDRSWKAFHHTIVVRLSKSCIRVPLAFLITDSETRVPLECWLKWLRVNSQLTETPTFMIDCSVTGVTGIKAMSYWSKFRYCQCPFFRDLSGHARKISKPGLKKDSNWWFNRHSRYKTMPEFTENWERYQQRYQNLNE